MFDVFYTGKKPNLFAHEQQCSSVEDARVKSRTRFFWLINYLTDYTGFNFLWEPCPWQANFQHAWPSQWQRDSGTYLIPKHGDSGVHYNTNFILKRLPEKNSFWSIPEYFDETSVDYSWHPDPSDPAMNYHFAVKWGWHNHGGVEYCVPGATELKYLDTVIAETKGREDYWSIPHNIDPESIDRTWCPDPADPPMIYHFPVAWGWERTGGPEYRVPGAQEIKFVDYFTARTHSDLTHWRIPDNIDPESFDFSWAPHPADPPYIYHFPTVWNNQGGPEYHVPGATQVKYTDQQQARTVPCRELWCVPEEIDENSVDFSWVPHPQDPPYIYHFATEYQNSVGLTYTVPGATEIKFAGDIPRKNKASAVRALDIFYLDRSNSASERRFAELKEKYPDIQKIRYANSLMDTIKRCVSRTKTSRFWVVGSLNDYSNFDFNWHPAPWQGQMTHVFGTQWNKWSDTFLINRWEFERNSKWAQGIEEFPNLNFVSDQQVVAPADASDIYVIDFGNAESEKTVNDLKDRYRVVKTARYFDNYLATLKRIVNDISDSQQHIWVTASICDYSRFDFSWQPEAWQSKMIHVFASNEQKFGDTFYINVAEFKEQMEKIELLDWFETVNYCTDQTVTRWPMPVIRHAYDTHVEAVKQSEWLGPLAFFETDSLTQKNLNQLPTVSLWREKTKTIVPLSPGASSVIVPKSAVPYIKTQLYDYPYIDKKQKHLRNDEPLDIVFIDNGEPNAEENWRWLATIHQHTGQRIERSTGVDGRVAAYQAAAKLSTTPWFFAVFAKLRVNPDFNWAWQPDRMQEPKHYIFHAKNPVNGLEYGHQAMIAYNRKLVLNNPGVGLDFTLDSAHEVVPILSGTAEYAQTPWSAWRTAFRECIKLKASTDIESQYRLQQWLKDSTSANGLYSMQGTQGIAVEYYDSVGGDFKELKKSYDWAWLASYAFVKHNLTPSQ